MISRAERVRNPEVEVATPMAYTDAILNKYAQNTTVYWVLVSVVVESILHCGEETT